MHRQLLAACALALVASLAFAAAAQAGGVRPGALELPGKRTATSNTYLNADGSYTAVVSPHAVNYRDVSGAWQPIDTTLVSSSTAGYAFQNAAGPFHALFKDGAGDGFVRREPVAVDRDRAAARPRGDLRGRLRVEDRRLHGPRRLERGRDGRARRGLGHRHGEDRVRRRRLLIRMVGRRGAEAVRVEAANPVAALRVRTGR